MKANITHRQDASEAEVKVIVTSDELEPFLREAAQKLSKDKPLKGFRPGKVPLEVAAKTFGREKLLKEALDRAVPRFFVRAVMDNNVDAIDRPRITVDKLSMDRGLQFTAQVAVLPHVTLGELSSITVQRRKVAVSDEDVERELKYLAKMRSTDLDVARPAQKGDTVIVDFKLEINGTEIEGGKSTNHPVNLGEGYFLPDFEKNLLGIRADDEREFVVTFPDDYAKQHLRGKQAAAWVKAHKVQKKVLPEINDEFAKKMGQFENLESLKYMLKSNLIKEREYKEQERLRGELAEKLAESASFTHIPEVLINKEIDRRIDEFSEAISDQQKNIDDYLANQGKTMAEMRKEMSKPAERAVKISLALREFSARENITVNEEEMEDKVNEYLKHFSSAKEMQEKLDPEEIKENVGHMLRNQKALKRLLELVVVRDSDEGTANK